MPSAHEYNLISADSHVVEPPDLFERHLPAGLRQRAPKPGVVGGAVCWLVEGADPVPLPASTITGSGWRHPGRAPSSFAEVLPALYDPSQRIVAQDADGVDAEVLYSLPGLWDAIRTLEDAAVQLACVRAYNDWLSEFCAQAPHRLIGLGRIPTTGLDDARDELLRCVKELGLKGVVLEGWPGGGPGLRGDDDAFWEVADDAGTPVSIHYALGGSSPTAPSAGIVPGLRPPMADSALPMVAAGLFDRFPDLKMVMAHGDAGWAVHWLEFTDINFVRHRHLAQYSLEDPDALPSEYIRRFFYFTVHEDRSAVRNRHKLGAEHLLWASHFPFDGADWPDDRRQAVRIAGDLPEEDSRAILARNTARLYRLPGYEDGFGSDGTAPLAKLVHF
jgi:predicted TIM-barrel fold metal-dependent hydrolase